MSKILISSHMRCGSTYLAEAASHVNQTQWKPLENCVKKATKLSQIKQLDDGVYKTHCRLNRYLKLPSDWLIFTIRREFTPSLISYIRWLRNARYPLGILEPTHLRFVLENQELDDFAFVNRFIQRRPECVKNFYRDWKAFQRPLEDSTYNRVRWFDYDIVKETPRNLLTFISTACDKPVKPALVEHWAELLTRSSLKAKFPPGHVNQGPSHSGWLTLKSTEMISIVSREVDEELHSIPRPLW